MNGLAKQVRRSSLELVDDSFYNKEQLQMINKKTPAKYIKKDYGGNIYVSVGYVIKKLNQMFGGNWDFQILTGLDEAADIAIKTHSAVVLGRLTIANNGRTISREQFGRNEVRFKKGTNLPVDFGNNFKGAASDSLKKCASLFGLFGDVYSADTFEEYGIIDDKDTSEAEVVKKTDDKVQQIADVVKPTQVKSGYVDTSNSMADIMARAKEAADRAMKGLE